MISEESKTIIEDLTKSGKIDFLEAATEEQIKKFERSHNFELPKKYREWLLFSDGGECFLPAGVQFYGVAHKPIIDVDDSDRPDASYIVIGALSTGDPIVFKKSDEKVSIYDHEANVIHDDEIYDDFFAFLKDLHNIVGIEED
jgi:hypothetical protein